MELVQASRYKVKVEESTYFTMRDGVRLAADVYRPEADGRFPALLSMGPYGKEQQRLGIPPQPWGSPLWDGTAEAGDTDYIVSRGYAHVIADVRGTGYSEGEYVGLLPKQEGQDGYDLVEALATQPWCDGNVGMVGMSYFGATQLLTAAEGPPHLKAICPYQAPTNLYRTAYDGGILNGFMHVIWGIHPGSSGIAPRNVASAMMKKLSKQELDRRIVEAKSNPDLKNYSYLYSVLANPERHPLFFDVLLNPTDGPFYWERSPHTKIGRIDIPVFIGAGCGAVQLYILAGTIDTYLELKGPKRLLLTEIANPDRPFHQWHDEFMRWFDYWLKGTENGILDEPPIKRFVAGANRWCYETEWPLAKTGWTEFYLRSHGRLSREPEVFHGVAPSSFVQEPLTITREARSLNYLTAPLIEDTEVAGPIALYLYASIDAADTNWMVSLNDVNTDGSEGWVTSGYLKASHRALDEGRSKRWRPYHPHTVPEPVVPGQIYEYAIEIQPTSYVFKKGHRIGLRIASMDTPPGYHFSFHVGSSKVTLHKIYCDGEHPSHLLMPIIL